MKVMRMRSVRKGMFLLYRSWQDGGRLEPKEVRWSVGGKSLLLACVVVADMQVVMPVMFARGSSRSY